MDHQKLFRLGMSTGATSLALILAAEGVGAPVDRQTCLDRLHAGPEELERSILELLVHAVALRRGEDLVLRPAAEWLNPVGPMTGQ